MILKAGHGTPEQRAGDIWFVDSEKECAELAKELMHKKGQMVGLDTETVGINPSEECAGNGKGRIVIWSCAWLDETLGTQSVTGYPLARRVAIKNWGEAEEYEWLNRFFRPWLQSTEHPKVGAYFFSFDRHIFNNHGIRVQSIAFDNVQASRTNDPSPLIGHSLKDQGTALGYDMREYGELFKRPYIKKNGQEGKKMLLVPLTEVVEDPEWLITLVDYASLDAKISVEAWPWMQEKLEAKSWHSGQSLADFYTKVKTPYLYLLQRIEEQGWKLDPQWCDEQSKIAEKDAHELERELLAWAGVPMNLNSPVQLAHLLYGAGFKPVQKKSSDLIKGRGWAVPPVFRVKSKAARAKDRENQANGIPVADPTPTDAIALDYLSTHLPAKKDREIVRKLMVYRKIKKLKQYLEKLPRFCDSFGYVHCQVRPDTQTGRLCVAKGTSVEVVRDVSAYPNGVPIEDVKVGDLAYTFDDKLNLCLRPVVWVGQTGYKRVVRVHWQGSGHQRKGFLDVTADHRVRLVDGSYVAAGQLVKGDRVLALSRGTSLGYARLWATGHDAIEKEHRFEKILVEAGWRISEAAKQTGYDRVALRSYADRHGFTHNVRIVRQAKRTWSEARRAAHPKTWSEQRRENQPTKYNHEILSVEDLGKIVPVYDLEVEETHNFIANQICVHNSASNPPLQQIPTPGKDPTADKYMIREAFTVDPGLVLLDADFCLAEGTKVQTPKGDTPVEDLRIGDLVFSYNRKTERPDCSKISATKYTGLLQTMVVVLDNGERVRCTGNHRWLMADGTEKRAKSLEEGDRLLPLRRSYAGPKKYETMYSRSALEYVYTHKAVAAANVGIEIGKLFNIIHHVDENHLNNHPDNLQFVTPAEHSQLHRENTVEQWKRPKTRKAMIAGISASIAARGGYHGKQNPNFGNRKGDRLVCRGCNKKFYIPPCRRVGERAFFCTNKCWRATKEGNADLNHKVVAVIRDGLTVPTYDIEVARDHNFALSAGVYVHNSQLEMRILAHFLIILFNDYGLANDLKADDLHAATAIRMKGVDELEVPDFLQSPLAGKVVTSWSALAPFAEAGDKWLNELNFLPRDTPLKMVKKFFSKLRNIGKILNFSIAYGKSAIGLGNELRDQDGDPIGQDAAQLLLDAYFDAYPALLKYVRWAIKYAERKGYAISLLGRKRPLPFINDFSAGPGRRSYKKGEAERQALNTPIQSSAADVTMTAQLYCNTFDEPALRDQGFFDDELSRMEVRQVMQIHDEIVFQAPRAHAREAQARIKMLMETKATALFPKPFMVALPAEVGRGMSWAAAK